MSVQVTSNKYHTCKKDFNWNPSACVCENSRYLKSIMCDEIINVPYSVETNVTNTIPKNVTSTVSMNSDDKKVRYKVASTHLIGKTKLYCHTKNIKIEKNNDNKILW